MPILANTVLVLIASPSDALDERATVRDELNDWSVTNGPRQGVVLLPWLFERHAVARMGDRPQGLINSQAVDKADVVVAFFDSRLGTDTGFDVSGTAEEIHRAIEQGKPVHVYFSQEPIPRDADLDQLQALESFKSDLQEGGLLGDYTDPKDLGGQVMRAIQADIEERSWGDGLIPSTRAGAKLSFEHVKETEPRTDSKGRPKTHTKRNVLVVTNASEVPAENLSLKLATMDDERMPHFDGPTDPVTIHGHSSRQWTLIPLAPVTVEVEATWIEDGKPRTQTFSFVTR